MNNIYSGKVNKLGIVATSLLVLSFFLPYLGAKGVSFIHLMNKTSIYNWLSFPLISIPVALFVLAGFIFSNRNHGVMLLVLSGILVIANSALYCILMREVNDMQLGVSAGVGCYIIYFVVVLYLLAGASAIGDRRHPSEISTAELQEEMKKFAINNTSVNRCIVCGSINRETNRFCNKCGLPLKKGN